ncbi:tyrosine--tRNA ligase [Intestinibacillus sp. Marseille-P6563]|uniref:tyrosine--tRNA ligase n=1 Tax=Intestinibacillus sp. Marseille-P6563 TaxID=2364792 RepID=UPI000F0690E4|nr:tyrosine--tRNA ligase [Intestinibacillus sp. Marseille-P6563]
MTVFEELKARGLIAQCTNEEKVQDLLDNHQTTFYIGFDATADSLHVGHFLQLVVMSRLQKAGHRPIALIGGGTTMIGDPTGKTDMRKMLTKEEIEHNAECFRKQMRRLVDFTDGKALMMNNADWILKFNYMDFLREVGVHFSVNRMLTAECFKSRLEKGLSFIEFNYMLLQSYDFLHLYRTMDCHLELGGDDQWSNIINGADLIRRVDGKDDAYGLTFTLLTTSEGKKMGKTEKGAVWLDPEKTSPYDFFQYWRNVDDSDVIRCLKLLTFVPLDEIAEFEKLEGAELNKVKERLAYEITSMVHGKEQADQALAAAKSLFEGGAADANMPSTILQDADFTDGMIGVLTLLVKCGLASSNGDARKLIQGGGISIDGEKVSDPKTQLSQDDFADERILKKGKKTYHKVMLEH